MSFLDDLKHTLSDVARKTSEIANDVKDQAKIKTEISKRKKAIEESFIAIGKKAFEDYQAGHVTDEALRVEFDQIKMNQDDIVGLEEQLQTITSFGDHMKEVVSNTKEAVVGGAKTAYESTKDFVSEKTEDIKEFVEKKQEPIIETVEDVKEEVVETAEEVKEDVQEKVEEVKENVQEKVEDVKEEVESVKENE
ncbi:hypothetical protein [Guggenheimella bovis]